MARDELEELWGKTLRSSRPTESQFDRLAQAVVDLYDSGDSRFRQHIKNRFNRVTSRTGQRLDPEDFDLATARAFIADEIEFQSWGELTDYIENQADDGRPILFLYAIAAMDMGNFTALESAVGGADKFDDQIREWYEKGYFEDEPETLAEVFSAACMLGYPITAAYLLDKRVDPLAGTKTGLNGFHYAASSGRLEVIKLLIERRVPMEVENMYGGTVFDQAIWSAVNEWTPYHAEIVEELVKAGAVIEEGYREWWNDQHVPDQTTKQQIADVLERHTEFYELVSNAKHDVAEAESGGNKRTIADSLKALGNILRRPPFLRDAADEAYTRAAELYHELSLPLEEAWVKRHIGINHEYAGRLAAAETYYDEALALYRKYSTDDDLNYANGVRYPAVIKGRLGKAEESARLWEEAHDRYRKLGPDGLGEGVAEAAAHLTLLALDDGNADLALKWFARASAASEASSDPDTHKLIAEVKARLEEST